MQEAQRAHDLKRVVAVERELWWKLVESGPPQVRPEVLRILQRWQADSDLASVREVDSLAKLPEDERPSWRTLWDEVAALISRVPAP